MTIELARERLTHLFQFFKAVEERRTPKIVDVNKHKWVMWLDSLPKHSKLKLATPTPDTGQWLVIQKPQLAMCPPFPEALNEWLDAGWDDPSYELAPKVKERTGLLGQVGVWPSATSGASAKVIDDCNKIRREVIGVSLC